MRPIFSQCAILQCDTTRIGQDAPCGAMPKLIHPSIPGPWHAPSLASWKTWQVLGRQGATWAGMCNWPNKEGSKRAWSSRVRSSRVESSRVEFGSQDGQSEHTSFSATDALQEMGAEFFPPSQDRPSPAPRTPGDHRPSASRGRIAGLRNQSTREPRPWHKAPSARGHAIGSCPSVDMGSEI